MEHIALYYFEKNNFKEAISAYNLLIESGENNNEPWQKIGFSKQMLGDIKGALEAYLHAELIESNNTWLLNRIAYCYRMLKNPDIALEYYKRLEQLKPEDLTIQLNIGHCYLEKEEFDEAMNYYFKIELSDVNNTRAWRPIAWCAFLSRKFDTARNYYGLIIDDNPTAHDYLNAGHVELCLNNIQKSVELYTISKDKSGGIENFKTLFFEDEKELEKAGIDINILPIILDSILYNEKEESL